MSRRAEPTPVTRGPPGAERGRASLSLARARGNAQLVRDAPRPPLVRSRAAGASARTRERPAADSGFSSPREISPAGPLSKSPGNGRRGNLASKRRLGKVRFAGQSEAPAGPSATGLSPRSFPLSPSLQLLLLADFPGSRAAPTAPGHREKFFSPQPSWVPRLPPLCILQRTGSAPGIRRRRPRLLVSSLPEAGPKEVEGESPAASTKDGPGRAGGAEGAGVSGTR